MNRLMLAALLMLWWGNGWAAPPDGNPLASTPQHTPLQPPDGSIPMPIPMDLPKGADILDWEVLGKVEVIYPKSEKPPKSKSRMEVIVPEGWAMPKPRFTSELKALNGQEVKIAGFMFPLDVAQEGQKRFLLSRMPPSCGFCLPGGPEAMVLVEAPKPIAFTMDAVIVKGRFAAMEHDKDGLFFKLSHAHLAKQE